MSSIVYPRDIRYPFDSTFFEEPFDIIAKKFEEIDKYGFRSKYDIGDDLYTGFLGYLFSISGEISFDQYLLVYDCVLDAAREPGDYEKVRRWFSNRIQKCNNNNSPDRFIDKYIRTEAKSTVRQEKYREIASFGMKVLGVKGYLYEDEYRVLKTIMNDFYCPRFTQKTIKEAPIVRDWKKIEEEKISRTAGYYKPDRVYDYNIALSGKRRAASYSSTPSNLSSGEIKVINAVKNCNEFTFGGCSCSVSVTKDSDGEYYRIIITATGQVSSKDAFTSRLTSEYMTYLNRCNAPIPGPSSIWIYLNGSLL